MNLSENSGKSSSASISDSALLSMLMTSSTMLTITTSGSQTTGIVNPSSKSSKSSARASIPSSFTVLKTAATVTSMSDSREERILTGNL